MLAEIEMFKSEPVKWLNSCLENKSRLWNVKKKHQNAGSFSFKIVTNRNLQIVTIFSSSQTPNNPGIYRGKNIFFSETINLKLSKKPWKSFLNVQKLSKLKPWKISSKTKSLISSNFNIGNSYKRRIRSKWSFEII